MPLKPINIGLEERMNALELQGGAMFMTHPYAIPASDTELPVTKPSFT